MANPYISANSKLGFGREATFGTRSTFATTPFTASTSTAEGFNDLGKFYADVIFPDAHVSVSKLRSFGLGRLYKRVQPRQIDRVGKLPIVPSNGQLFAYLLGAETSTSAANGNGTVTHTIDIANRAILPSMTLVALMNDDAGTRQFQRTWRGVVLESADITVSKEEELRADLGILAKDIIDSDAVQSSGNRINPSFNGFTNMPGRPYLWMDSVATLTTTNPAGSDRNSGVTIARAESMKMSYKNKHQVKRYLGGNQNPSEFLTSIPEFSVGMDFVPAGFLSGHGADSIYDLLDATSNNATGTRSTFININIKLTKQAESSGVYEDSIQFLFSDCIITEADHSWKIDGNEMVVPVNIEPRKAQVIVKDNFTWAYSAYTS